MHTLDLESPITLIDGDWVHVHSEGSIVRLRNLADGSIRDFHLAEIAQRMVGLSSAFPVLPNLLNRIPDQARTETVTMAHHLYEILTGVNPSLELLSADYDPATTSQNQRIETKIAELARHGTPISRRTIMRKLGAMRAAGTAGLIDGRALKQFAPMGRPHDLVKDALCEVIAAQLNASTGTKSRIIHQTEVLLLKLYGNAAPELPSKATMYRYIDLLSHNRHTTGSAKTRSSLGQRPDRTFGHRHVDLPGQEMQADSTTLDMQVTTDNGDIIRPILTILVDRATRMIVAFTLRVTATTGVDHSALLAQALTPAQNRPSLVRYREELLRMNPNLTLLDPARRQQLEATLPYIRPSTLVIDNGSDYKSDSFSATTESLGINVVYSAPHTPTSKPLVERMFGSINTLFTQYQPGYVGSSPVNRGRNPEKDELLYIHALTEKFDDWVLETWNNRPHASLRDRRNPNQKLSPNQMYRQASAVTSQPYLPLTTADYILMLPSVDRAITSTGVQVRKRHYDSVDLHPHRNQKSSDPSRQGLWEVKFDQRNPDMVWVRVTPDEWVECVNRNVDRARLPHQEELTATPKDAQRNEVALINTARFGVPIHRDMTAADFTLAADDPHDDDDSYEPFGSVNHDEDF